MVDAGCVDEVLVLGTQSFGDHRFVKPRFAFELFPATDLSTIYVLASGLMFQPIFQVLQ